MPLLLCVVYVLPRCSGVVWVDIMEGQNVKGHQHNRETPGIPSHPTDSNIADQLLEATQSFSIRDQLNVTLNSASNVKNMKIRTERVGGDESAYLNCFINKSEQQLCKSGDMKEEFKTVNSTGTENCCAHNLGAAVRESFEHDSKYISRSKTRELERNFTSGAVNEFGIYHQPNTHEIIQEDFSLIKDRSPPTSKDFKRPSLNIALAESALKLLPEDDEVNFTPDSAYEEDWPSDSRRVGGGGGSVSGESSSSYSRRASSTGGDSDCLEPCESISRRASSGIGSTDGRSVYSRAQSIEDEPGESVSRRASSNTCEGGGGGGGDSIEDTAAATASRERSNRRLEVMCGSKESLNRRTSGGANNSNNNDLLDNIHDPLSRRDSLLEAVLAAKRGGWRNLTRSESVDSASSFASSLNSSLASDTSGCPCDDCLLGLTQPPKPKKVRSL